ncbi:MAG TPA: polysaccharide deacetylase family protein [Patescibacteria group bacterium]|nr:polysaccharide deacetylase family protein [Patescibacteria group bacterium]
MTSPAGPDRAHPLANLLTIMWHYVRTASATPAVGVPWLDVADFDAQLDRIGRTRTVVGWSEVRDALSGGDPLPTDAALLTFDDGLVDHHAIVGPRLADRGWPAIFFVTARRPGESLSIGHSFHVLLAVSSPADLRAAVLEQLGAHDRIRFLAAERREEAAGVDPIDVLKRPIQRDLAAAAEPVLGRLIAERLGPEAAVADTLHLSPRQVGELRAWGLTIGGHGRRHVWFDHESAAVVQQEIADSAAFLAGDPGPWPFAYPYGASGPGAGAALAEAGFAAAFHASPQLATGMMGLGRIDGEAAGFEDLLQVRPT